MHTQSTLNVPLLIELLNEPYEMQVLERLLEQNPGGITKLPVGLAYFEFEFEGERLIFGNEMRQRIETALGATLQERAYPNYRTSASESKKMDLHEWASSCSPAGPILCIST